MRLRRAPRELFNQNCSLLPVFVFLKDHKSDTLSDAVHTVERFAADHNTQQVQFLLATGNAGIEAVTNIVVRKVSREMLYWVYGSVMLLCFVTFRSWRAVAVAILPLALTSMLCQAPMVWMGIDVKVATLPAIALGVNYALYVLSAMLVQLHAGATLKHEYGEALRFTGKVVMLTWISLELAVATWILSPLKFQADIVLLLWCMVIWNIFGAPVLLPTLEFFLLKLIVVHKGIN